MQTNESQPRRSGDAPPWVLKDNERMHTVKLPVMLPVKVEVLAAASPGLLNTCAGLFPTGVPFKNAATDKLPATPGGMTPV